MKYSVVALLAVWCGVLTQRCVLYHDVVVAGQHRGINFYNEVSLVADIYISGGVCCHWLHVVEVNPHGRVIYRGHSIIYIEGGPLWFYGSVACEVVRTNELVTSKWTGNQS